VARLLVGDEAAVVLPGEGDAHGALERAGPAEPLEVEVVLLGEDRGDVRSERVVAELRHEGGGGAESSGGDGPVRGAARRHREGVGVDLGTGVGDRDVREHEVAEDVSGEQQIDVLFGIGGRHTDSLFGFDGSGFP
jgi:hypothetical protein